MAEASNDSLFTPEKDEFNDGSVSRDSSRDQDCLSNGRSTSVDSNHGGRSSLRNSAEKSESAKSSTKVVPHYLRASTGSCHDLCKFGREHSFETKPRKPIRKRIAKLSPVQILISDGKKEEVVTVSEKKEDVVSVGKKKKEDVVSVSKNKKEAIAVGKKKEDAVFVGQEKEEVVLGDQKNEEENKVVISVDQKGGEENEEVVFYDQKEGQENEEVVVSIGERKEEAAFYGTPTDMKDSLPSRKPSPRTKSSPAKTSFNKEKAIKNKPSTHTNNHSPNSPFNKSNLGKIKLPSNTKPYSSKQNDSSGSKKSLSSKKSPSEDPPEIVKSVIFPYTEVEDPLKKGSSSDSKTSKTQKRAASVAKKLLSPVKLTAVKVKSSSSCDDSDITLVKGRRKSSSLTGTDLVTSKASPKNILTPSAAQTSKPSPNKKAEIKSGKPKLASSLKDTRRVSRKASKSENVTEKTLHVITMETKKNVYDSIPSDIVISSPPSPSSAKPSAYGKSSPESGESLVEVDKGSRKKAPVKENHNKTTIRKSRGVVCEDKRASPVKLKFRMGKVVDLQSDNNTPRRLRFSRARFVVAEDSKGDLRRKTSKRAAVNGDTASVSSQKVVLKHQDVQAKKDAQGLLNNVIEETASKLALSRKSKVKALVGAFETVISLQEIKPSTQVVT